MGLRTRSVAVWLVLVAIIVGISATVVGALSLADHHSGRAETVMRLEDEIERIPVLLHRAHSRDSSDVVAAERAVRDARRDLTRVTADSTLHSRALTAAGVYLGQADEVLVAIRAGEGQQLEDAEAAADLALVDAMSALERYSHQREREASRAAGVARVVTIAATPVGVILVALVLWHLARRRQVESDLRVMFDMRAGHEALVQHASDLILITAETGEIRYAGPASQRVLGIDPSSGTNTNAFAIAAGDDEDKLREAVRAATQPGGSTQRVEIEARHRDGSLLHLEVQCTDLRSDHRIAGVVWNCRDVTERRILEDRLTHQAFHDSLTGLANRALFHDHLDLALDRQKRHAGILAVMMLDLDGFKEVNDRLGHDAGDMVLIEVAGRLAACVRQGDTVARLGGDEFAILLEDLADESVAKELANRVVNAVAEPLAIGDDSAVVGVSVGLAFAGGVQAGAQVVRNADFALYRAKERGRGCVVRFEGEANDRAEGPPLLDVGLSEAIERSHEFVVHYQPLVELDSLEIVGMEALVRWQHPARGCLLPGEFLGLAEQSQAILRLGRWVLHQACRQAVEWRHLPGGERLKSMCVNLSALQLGSPQLASDVASALEVTGLAPEVLVLEIPESALQGDQAPRAEQLGALKQLGVRLAIDDFGTGRSSLAHLRQLPIDILKIDGSLVEASTSQMGAALVNSVLSMAAALNLEVVAEGIEGVAENQALLAAGCAVGQGFLFAKPMPPDQMPLSMVARSRGTTSWQADDRSSLL